MDEAVHKYFVQALAPSTTAAYHSVANRYFKFCHQFNLSPLPLHQDSVVRFIAHLAQGGLGYQSLRSYLSALRYLQVSRGFPDPCLTSIPMLEYVMRGIRRAPRVTNRPQRNRVTPEILRLLLAAWSQGSLVSSYDATMLWAACCTGFFGFLRAGEFTCPSLQAFAPDMLSPQDVSVDSHNDPSSVMVRLRRSKADPFGASVTIFLGKTAPVNLPGGSPAQLYGFARIDSRPTF